MRHFHSFLFARNMLFTMLGILLMSGCAIKRDKYELPLLNLPAQYPKAAVGVVDTNPATSSSSVSAPSTVLLNLKLTEWWRLLGSRELNSLMDRALANNTDLRIATLRIAQSKARLSQAGADRLPAISLPLQSSSSYPENGVGNGRASGNKLKTTNQFSLKAVWRPDIWGENASLYESAEMQLLRATYQRDDMQRNVVANLVVTYIEYLSLNDRLRVAQDTEKALSNMLTSVGERLKAGDATITELEQQKAAVYSVKATIPVLGQQRETVLNRLAGLLGSAPVELKLSSSGLDSIKFPQVLPDMPSALLVRRPDVRAAEFRLLSADADIDVARARVLPPLDLTAQIGYGSLHLSQILLPQSLFWNTIANLTISIFDAGKRTKEVEFSRALHEELLETYVRVIYEAAREVDNSLSGLSYTKKRLETQQVATESALLAWKYSQEAFMAGAVDFLILLDTQRTHQRNLDDLYNVRMDRYRSLVNLFSALGGGIPNNDAPIDEEQFIQAVTTTSSREMGQAARKRGDTNESGSIDWNGRLLENGKTHWLVELSGVYDGGAVLPAWRDLNTRFPQEIGSHSLLPQRQGQITAGDKERNSWYRLFVAGFSGKQAADEFCAFLTKGQQRCLVVSSEAIEEKGDFAAPPILTQQLGAALWEELAEKSSVSSVAMQAASEPVPMLNNQSGVTDAADSQFWLVAMSDLHDRNAITGAWRDLIVRFPAQMKNKTIIPRSQVRRNSEGKLQDFLYQLFVARFQEEQAAEEFCALLRTGQQGCSVVSSRLFTEKKDGHSSPTTERETYQGNKP